MDDDTYQNYISSLGTFQKARDDYKILASENEKLMKESERSEININNYIGELRKLREEVKRLKEENEKYSHLTISSFALIREINEDYRNRQESGSRSPGPKKDE